MAGDPKNLAGQDLFNMDVEDAVKNISYGKQTTPLIEASIELSTNNPVAKYETVDPPQNFDGEMFYVKVDDTVGKFYKSRNFCQMGLAG